MSDTVQSAVEERLKGGRPSRAKAFFTAVAIGFGAFLLSYRLLRSGGD
jgi:hypothetical protein